jgi:hypothetical protein
LIFLIVSKTKVTVSCIATNSAGSSVATMSLTPMDPEEDEDDVCGKQEAFGIVWPVTMRGQTSIQPCPSHYDGNSQRLCDFETVDKKPTWNPPVFDECHSAIINSLKDKVSLFI